MGSGTAIQEEPRRVNFILTERAYKELSSLAKAKRSSMTELIRLGLGLVKVALEAEQKGNKLVVTTADGQPLKEIVLPS